MSRKQPQPMPDFVRPAVPPPPPPPLKAGIKEDCGLTSVPSEISVVADTVQISKEKLQDLEWELRAWRECFPALKYNQEIFKIEERGNVKEGTNRQERIDGSPDRAPSTSG